MLRLLRAFAAALLLLVLSALLCASGLSAQSAPQSSSPSRPVVVPQPDDASDEDSDDAAAQKSTLTVGISFVDNSTIEVRAYVFVHNLAQPSAFDLKSALQESLGCALTDRSGSKTPAVLYLGSCKPARSGSPFLRTGRVLTAPLQRICESRQFDALSVTFDLADTETSEAIPPATVPPFSQLEVATFSASQQARFADIRKSFETYSKRHPVYTWTPNQSMPASISYRFGYAPSTIQRAAIVLGLLLIAPIALVFWLGRKALSANVADKAMVWFSYMRTLSWILNGSILCWWAALEFFHVEQILRFAAADITHASLLSHPVFSQILGWLPPSLIWLCCNQLSHPVQQKLRGLRWTKRELATQSLYSVIAGFFPIALFLSALQVLPKSSPSAALLFAAAILIRNFAANALLKVTGMQPHALTSGPLRDRAFEMAHRLGVKLQQVYLIPSGKGQMANAFASSKNHIAFTDIVLQRMSAREIDFVMAHELTHLQRKHPVHLVWARLIPLFLVISLSPFFLAGPKFAFVRYLIILVLVTVVPYFVSRRFEYSADGGAVKLTGDPRAAISALFKLSELNMMPTQWSRWNEKWLTHPSTLRRAQSIAKLSAIPFAEIPSIARTPAEESVPSYLPQSVSAPVDKLYSSQFKRAAVQKIAWALLAVLSFVPSFFALAALRLSVPYTFQVVLFLAAVPVTFGALMILSNWIPRLTRGNSIARLEQKFLAQGVQVKPWAGTYVGFAPSAAPRSFELNSSWDFGYLFFRSDRICFWGEETQFALHRDQITAIKLDLSAPSWLRTKRIYIAWRDVEKNSCGVFNIACDYADSVLAGIRQTTTLSDRLHVWWQTPSPARTVPQPLDQLSSPTVRAVTAGVPGFRGTNKLFSELLITSLIAALAAMLCGLPFHLVAYLTNPSRFGVPVPNPFHSPGAGWFVVFVAALVRFLSVIPSIRYRDRALLVAQPLTSVRVPAPPPPIPASTPAASPALHIPIPSGTRSEP